MLSSKAHRALALGCMAAFLAAVLVLPPSPAAAQTPSRMSGQAGFALEPGASAAVPTLPPARTALGQSELMASAIDPETYRVGPGDEFQLVVPGVFEMPVLLVVDAEGGLVLPGSAGRVQVGGHSLASAREEVRQALTRLVRQREFALSLVRPRRFKVYVTGAVTDPGAYEASPVTRVSEVIDLAGGILPNGSARTIRVQRQAGAGQAPFEIGADLAAFAGRGDLAANPPLDGGDVIRVPFRGPEVGVFGGVNLPGVYELAAGETVGSAIELAGGLAPGARLDLATLSRAGGENRSEELLDLRGAAHPSAGDSAAGGASPPMSRPLAAGDVLVIPIAADAGAIHHVEVEGEVAFPGSYPIQPGIDTPADAIARAGGFTGEANVDGVRVVRARPPAAVAAESGGATPNGESQGGTAGAAGATGNPAREPAAVTSPPAFRDLPRAERERQLLAESDTGDDVRAPSAGTPPADSVRLLAGDRIVVPRAEGRVRVDGRVRAPGLVPFTAGQEIEDYVELAGGYDKRADKRHVYVQRAGRPGLEAASGADPVRDGDAIWVPESEPRGLFGSLRDFMIFLASVATVAIVVDQVVSN
jgi:protein involved in polysaccharide export with SLBB domain